jgi:hypothetical protein
MKGIENSRGKEREGTDNPERSERRVYKCPDVKRRYV